MSGGRMIFWLAALLLALWLAGFAWFTREVAVLSPPPAPKAVGIVVLTGGGGRVAEGVKLLAAGAGKRLLVSGVHPEVTLSDLLASAAADGAPINEQLAACCVALGYAAGSTEGNAREATDWVAGWKDPGKAPPSLLVVTANYHLPRALLEFHRALPRAELVPYPLARDIAAGPWWQSPDSARLLLTEYVKYTAALARATFDLLRGHS